VLAAWKTWDGDFKTFALHTRDELRLPFGFTAISTILAVEGLRHPQKRPGRTPDEIALRGAFQTFFPGAQWVGDGMHVPLVFEAERFAFNMELDVDACSGAFVGLHVSDAEDSDAVIAALHDGVATTGSPPLALLLDNKPSNHTAEVDEALGETLRIRATLARPQNKAHVEGAFGLFAQTVPPIDLPMGTPRERARALLDLVATTFARAFNHRPRKDRNGRSRFDLYRETCPTQEQIDLARNALRERARQQELARQTALARSDHSKLQMLDEALHELGILDTESHVRVAIARYPAWAIKQALAIFAGKKRAGSLPPGVDARYLLGIVTNITQERELEYFAESLLHWRLRHRDIHLELLAKNRDAIVASAPTPADSVLPMLARCLDAERMFDSTFWIDAAASTVDSLDPDARVAVLADATRRIRFAHRVPVKKRTALVARLTRSAVPDPDI